MNETAVGIRELKTHLNRYVDEVKAGSSILITEHGKPVGRIVPIASTLDERLRQLEEAGVLAWGGGGRLPALEPQVLNQGPVLLSDLVLEDRD